MRGFEPNYGDMKMPEQIPEQIYKTPEEKKKQLFLDQKKLLDTFLSHGAITVAQYNKSLGDLTEKMHMEEVLKESMT